MLAPAGGLLISQDHYAVIGRIVRQRRRKVAGAIEAVEDEDAAAEMGGLQVPGVGGSSLLQIIQGDVEGRGRVRQGADADAIDAGFRDGANRFQVDAAGRFQFDFRRNAHSAA